MSGIQLEGWDGGIAVIRSRVDRGVEKTADAVLDQAKARAPVRKAFKSSRKASRAELADFQMKIGRRGSPGTFTGADIEEAASQLGISLDATQVESFRRGNGMLKAQANTRASLGANNLSWTRTKRSKITGRDLRVVTRARDISGKPTGGLKFDTARLKRQKVVLLGRAKREARIGTGVITVKDADGKTRRQYGGYLRKHIVKVVPTEVADRIVFTVRSQAPYSRYVEFPTSRTAAQPFLLPALKANRNRLRQNIQQAKG